MWCEVSSNLGEENMDEILRVALDFIYKVGYKFGQTGSLIHLDFIIRKRLENLLDTYQLRSALILNNRARLFHSLKISYAQKNSN